MRRDLLKKIGRGRSAAPGPRAERAYSAQSERGFHAIVNAPCVSGPRTPIWDQGFTMTSVTDGFQICRARIHSRRGMSVSWASLPAEPGEQLRKLPRSPVAWAAEAVRRAANSGPSMIQNRCRQAAVRGLR